MRFALFVRKSLRNMMEQREQILQLILSYLGKHPGTQDTLEGITYWWLTFERIELSTSVVEDALEVLIRQGLVARRVSQDGTILYKLDERN
jgi:Fe2+ or Zn2+ uptake regulation protein